MFSDNPFKVIVQLYSLSKYLYIFEFFHHDLFIVFFPSYNQVEIIKDLPEDTTLTVYRCGPLVDLCRGPHIPNTSFVKAFSCLKVRSSFCWK